MRALVDRMCCVLVAHNNVLMFIDTILDTLGICPW
jgi:hypothetical protein